MWRVSKKFLSNYMALLMLQPHNLCWTILKLSNPSTTTKRSVAGYGQQENGNASGGTCCNGCKYVGNPYLNGKGDRTMNKVVGFKVQERANDKGQ